MCFANNSPVWFSSLAFSTASRKSSSPSARKRRQPVAHTWFLSQRSVTAICPFGRRLAPPCLVQCQAVEGAVEDGAGKSGARLRLDAALEAAEDGHVAGLQVRRASWREECEHDVSESGSHGCQGGLAGVDAGRVPEKDPRLSLPPRVHHVVQEWPRAAGSSSSLPSRSPKVT